MADTILFSDTFSGAAGTIVGRAPDTMAADGASYTEVSTGHALSVNGAGQVVADDVDYYSTFTYGPIAMALDANGKTGTITFEFVVSAFPTTTTDYYVQLTAIDTDGNGYNIGGATLLPVDETTAQILPLGANYSAQYTNFTLPALPFTVKTISSYDDSTVSVYVNDVLISTSNGADVSNLYPAAVTGMFMQIYTEMHGGDGATLDSIVLSNAEAGGGGGEPTPDGNGAITVLSSATTSITAENKSPTFVPVLLWRDTFQGERGTVFHHPPDFAISSVVVESVYLGANTTNRNRSALLSGEGSLIPAPYTEPLYTDELSYDPSYYTSDGVFTNTSDTIEPLQFEGTYEMDTAADVGVSSFTAFHALYSTEGTSSLNYTGSKAGTELGTATLLITKASDTSLYFAISSPTSGYGEYTYSATGAFKLKLIYDYLASTVELYIDDELVSTVTGTPPAAISRPASLRMLNLMPMASSGNAGNGSIGGVIKYIKEYTVYYGRMDVTPVVPVLIPFWTNYLLCAES